MCTFENMKEPRRVSKGNFKHPLMEIFFLVVSAVVSGSDDWHSVVLFGKYKLDWLKKFFPYVNGIPSHDTIERLFSALCPQSFGTCFIDWASGQFQTIADEVIAIDGKRMRGSGTKLHPAIHMVSAFASKQRLTLGQLAVEEKSNEITAIPALLDLIDLKNGTVTIDAMGCQTAIAEKIISKDADYILAVKDNQMELNQQVRKMFEMNKGTEISETFDFGHGRIETRNAEVITDLTFLDTKEKWAGLKSIIKIYTHRIHKLSGKEETETRYYISSSNMAVSKFNSAIRGHWAIENNLHWCLDVVFKEDSSKRRKGNSAVNFNLVAKIALKLIENTDVVLTKPKKRESACLNDDFRELVLGLF